MVKKKKIPQRKCVVTNELKPKKDLIRIVRNKEGDVFVDPTGKKNGRGAYLSNDPAVIDKAEKNDILSRQLDTAIDSSVYEELRQFVTDGPDEK
ncbi:glucose-induced regulator RulR [Barrientosiimonas marina]|uniref:RNase P modulator RnpM n=1 Tax=Lentibacillus kimchii TaxID=1542911 RepID=A0ABW2UPY4_9BACI